MQNFRKNVVEKTYSVMWCDAFQAPPRKHHKFQVKADSKAAARLKALQHIKSEGYLAGELRVCLLEKGEERS